MFGYIHTHNPHTPSSNPRLLVDLSTSLVFEAWPAVVALLAALAGYASAVVVRGEAQQTATARRLLGQAQQLYGQKRRRAEAVRLYSQGWTQLAGELTVAHVRAGSAMEESAKCATGGPGEALGSRLLQVGPCRRSGTIQRRQLACPGRVALA